VEQRLRREPAVAPRLQSDALGALWQGHLRGRPPRFAGEILEIGGYRDACPRNFHRAHDPKHVWTIVRQPAARVGEVVWVWAEDSVGRQKGDGAELRASGSRPAESLKSGNL